MRVDFSKPSGDIATETEGFVARDEQRLAREREISAHLVDQPSRVNCILCGAALKDDNDDGGFIHRGIAYVRCASCDHVQTKAQLPAGYPHAVDGVGFEAVYPKLGRDEYVSRRERIYAPKRDWILSCLEDAGRVREHTINARWLELGCGAGYFLSALRDVGAENIAGVEQNPELLTLADEHLGPGIAQLSVLPLAELIGNTDADVITAFFVLEHLEDAQDVWAALAQLPSGTVFAFSVPVFGFATLLESAFPEYSARNLDTVLHTQLYTDASIAHALSTAGYTEVGTWVFGQDALDLKRLLLKQLAPVYSKGNLVAADTLLSRMVDDMQGAIDQNWLADARHIVAIKD